MLVPKEKKAKSTQDISSKSARERGSEPSQKTTRAPSVYETLVPFEFEFPEDLKILRKHPQESEGIKMDACGIVISVTKEESPAFNNEEGPPTKYSKPLHPGTSKSSSATASTADSLNFLSSADKSDQAKASSSMMKTKNSGRSQLAECASDLLNARGDRTHVFLVRVNDRSITFTLYHWAAIIEAELFNLSEHQLYLALFLTRFQRDPSAVGLCADIGFHNPFGVEDISSQFPNVDMKRVSRDPYVTLKQGFALDHIQVSNMVDQPQSFIGRGTTVRDVIIPGVDKDNVVAKCSWQVADRDDESKHIASARRVTKKHAPEVYARGTIKQDPMIDALTAKCDRRKSAHYERRELRALLMKKYKLLASVKSSKTFKRAVTTIAGCELNKLVV